MENLGVEWWENGVFGYVGIRGSKYQNFFLHRIGCRMENPGVEWWENGGRMVVVG